MVIKVSAPTEQQEYVWQVASGQWFATAVQQQFVTRAEAINATRAELDRIAALIATR